MFHLQNQNNIPTQFGLLHETQDQFELNELKQPRFSSQLIQYENDYRGVLKDCMNHPSKSPHLDDHKFQRTRNRIDEIQTIIDEIQGGIRSSNKNEAAQLQPKQIRSQTPTNFETTPKKQYTTITPLGQRLQCEDYSNNNNHPNFIEPWQNYQKSDVVSPFNSYLTNNMKNVQEKSRMLTPPIVNDEQQNDQKYSDLFTRYIHRQNNSLKNPISPKFPCTADGKQQLEPSQSPLQKRIPQTAQQNKTFDRSPIHVTDFEFQLNQYIPANEKNDTLIMNHNYILNQKPSQMPLTQNNIQYNTQKQEVTFIKTTQQCQQQQQDQQQLQYFQQQQLTQGQRSPLMRKNQQQLQSNGKQQQLLVCQKNENYNGIQVFGIVQSVLPESMILDNIDNYNLGKVLGLGSYAVVRLAQHKQTGQRMAIKTYEKSKLVDQQKRKNVTREMKILSKLRHQSIIKLHHAVETQTQLHLIMEFTSSNSLSTYLKSKVNRRMSEDEARYSFRQIMDAIKYCHHKNVVHRDIKLENILIDDNNCIRLIDFGFSIAIDPATKLNVFCGTPSYMAPEIVNKIQYSFAADIWALGILLFKMVTGSFPFRGQDDKELYKRINQGKIEYPIKLSNNLKQLIQRILKVNQDERPNAKEVLQDQWFNMQSGDPMEEEYQRIV